MENIKHYIPRDTLLKFQDLIGKKLQFLYADRFLTEYSVPYMEASFLVLNFGKNEQLKITTNWFECDKTYDDFYIMKTQNINFIVEHNTSIFSFFDTGYISKITILNKKHSDDSFNIESFHGVIIERTDSKRILISGGESAFQNLIISDNPIFISNFINESLIYKEIN